MGYLALKNKMPGKMLYLVVLSSRRNAKRLALGVKIKNKTTPLPSANVEALLMDAS